MEGKNGSYKKLALFLVGLILIMPIWHLVSEGFKLIQGFFGFGSDGLDNVTNSDLSDVFVVLISVVAVMITLFTPSKKLSSPLNYFAEKIQGYADGIKIATDYEKKREQYVALGVNAIILLAFTAVYFFVIKNLVTVEAGDVSDSIFSILIKMVTIGVYLWFSSFIIAKFSEIDTDTTTDEGAKETKRNTWTVGLIIGSLVVLGLGNGLGAYLNDALFNNSDSILGDQVKEILGGDGDNGIGEDTIDIIQ